MGRRACCDAAIFQFDMSTQNACIERLSKRAVQKDYILSVHKAQEITEFWLAEYNHERTLERPNGLTPE